MSPQECGSYSGGQIFPTFYEIKLFINLLIKAC